MTLQLDTETNTLLGYKLLLLLHNIDAFNIVTMNVTMSVDSRTDPSAHHIAIEEQICQLTTQHCTTKCTRRDRSLHSY